MATFDIKGFEEKWRQPKKENIDAARAAALEEGKKYIGDATSYERFKDALFDVPDAAVALASGTAETLSEFVLGLAKATWQGTQVATTKDPERVQEILERPGFTSSFDTLNYPRTDIYESQISGITPTDMMEWTGKYVAPLPGAAMVAPIKAIPRVAKGIIAARTGQKVANVLDEPALNQIIKSSIIKESKIPKNLPMLNAYKDFINTTFSKPIKNISTEEHLIDSLSKQLGHTSKNQTFRVIKEMKDAGLFTKSASKNYNDYLINRSIKVNKGLISKIKTKKEETALANTETINNLINKKYPDFKKLDAPEKAKIFEDISTKVMQDSNVPINPQRLRYFRKKWNELTGDDVLSTPHATTLEAGKRSKVKWNETPIFDSNNPGASLLNTKLQGNLRKDKRFNANLVIDNLRKNNSRVDELLNTIEGFENIQSKTGAKNIGKRIYEVDHVQDFRFGGTNELDNFYITTKMPHRGLKKATALFKKIYPDKVMKSKSSFGDVVHKNYLTIIEHLKKGNFEAAEKLSMKTQKYIDDVIESKPAYSFIIDEPYKPHKTGTRYNEAEYINQVSLLPKELQAKAKQLIVRREYVPDMFKTNLKGEAKIIKQLEDFRDTTFNIPVDVRETQRFFNRGGLVGINHLTRPL